MSLIENVFCLSSSYLFKLLPADSVVLRLMPNLPCLLQEGALLFTRGSRAGPENGALLRSLLQHCGLVEEGPEAWIDVHTGLSGSGVAFVSMRREWKEVRGKGWGKGHCRGLSYLKY